MQANRYPVTREKGSSGQLDNRQMETNNERRLRKLRLLCQAHGLAEVAARSGQSEASLDQILKGVKLPPKKGDGSRSERALGDTAARAIEDAYELGRGWFDNNSEEETMTPMELELIGLFRQLGDDEAQSLIIAGLRQAVEDRARALDRIRANVTSIDSRRRRPRSGKPPL